MGSIGTAYDPGMTPEKAKYVMDTWDITGPWVSIGFANHDGKKPRKLVAGQWVRVVYYRGWFNDVPVLVESVDWSNRDIEGYQVCPKFDKKTPAAESELPNEGINTITGKKEASSADRFMGRSTIWGKDGEHRTPYMTRWWIGRLRLHIFYRGDQDPDCHDHPWDFWTFPLTPYVEEVVCWHPEHHFTFWQVVPALRFTFRPAEHTHRVIGRYDGWFPDFTAQPCIETNDKKVITIVWRSKDKRKWGFLKNRDGRWCWTPWKEYVFGNGKSAPCE